MKPILQTPDTNCLQVCIAMLLERDIKSVPNFVLEEGEKEGFPAWWFALQMWLSDFGLHMIEVALPSNYPWNPVVKPALCILFGDTSTGVKHAVVGRVEDDKFLPVFDPLPKAGGLTSITNLGFLAPRDPNVFIQLGIALEKIAHLSAALPSSEIARNIHYECQQALGLGINGNNGPRIIH